MSLTKVPSGMIATQSAFSASLSTIAARCFKGS